MQTFEKEDGSTFTGLGLVAEYGLPTGNIQFDAPEPSNSDSNRKSRGNNRWQYSNLRQWLYSMMTALVMADSGLPLSIT